MSKLINGTSILGAKSPWKTAPLVCVPLGKSFLGQTILEQMYQTPILPYIFHKISFLYSVLFWIATFAYIIGQIGLILKPIKRSQCQKYNQTKFWILILCQCFTETGWVCQISNWMKKQMIIAKWGGRILYNKTYKEK